MAVEVAPEFDSDDLQALRGSLDRFLLENYTFEQRKIYLASPETFSRRVWKALADLGLLGLGIRAENGGMDGGVTAVGAVMEAFGSWITTEPYLSSIVVGARLLDHLDGARERELLAEVMEGDRFLALAHAEPALGYARSPIASQARIKDGAYSLTGAKNFVLGGHVADTFIVTTAGEKGVLSAFLVQRYALGVNVKPFRTVDGRGAADLVFQDAPAKRLETNGDVAAMVDEAMDFATVTLAWEAVGGMAAVIEGARNYMETRQQFGHPLSDFQVLRHRLVDMYIMLEETRAMAEHTAREFKMSVAERQIAVSALKVHLNRAARAVGQQGIQLHGGMGMTDALHISHHFKRLMMVEALFGDTEFHLSRHEQVRARMCRETGMRRDA